MAPAGAGFDGREGRGWRDWSGFAAEAREEPRLGLCRGGRPSVTASTSDHAGEPRLGLCRGDAPLLPHRPATMRGASARALQRGTPFCYRIDQRPCGEPRLGLDRGGRPSVTASTSDHAGSLGSGSTEGTPLAPLPSHRPARDRDGPMRGRRRRGYAGPWRWERVPELVRFAARRAVRCLSDSGQGDRPRDAAGGDPGNARRFPVRQSGQRPWRALSTERELVA